MPVADISGMILNAVVASPVAILLTWKLLTSKSTGFSTNVDNVVLRLFSVIWEAAIPPAILAVVN